MSRAGTAWFLAGVCFGVAVVAACTRYAILTLVLCVFSAVFAACAHYIEHHEGS